MIEPPEVSIVDQPRVACDGATETHPALGHPRVYIQIDDAIGYGECGYCDRRFVLRGGAADVPVEEVNPDQDGGKSR